MMADPKVLGKITRPKEDVRGAISRDWFETRNRVGIGRLLEATGAKSTDTIDNAITQKHVPELHTALNSLVADDAALFQTLLLYGGCFVRVQSSAEDDMAVISGMLRAATEYLERMKDNRRCPSDTSALAKLFIPLIPAMLSIVEEAKAVRG